MTAKKQLSQSMVDFFQSYDAAEGVPSFEKFADAVGIDSEELLELSRQSLSVGRAYRRCLAILRDRLTDGALLRRYDPSFCKYALDSLNCAVVDSGEKAPLEVEIKIV